MNDQPRELRVNPKLLGSIRRATRDDLPFIATLLREQYGDRFHDPDKLQRLLDWATPLFERGDHTALVGRNCMGLARIVNKYGCEPTGQLEALAARPGAGLEALRMVRVMLLWAKAMGAKGTFTLHADTGVDFEPFARRLNGSRVVTVKYEIPLEE